MEQATEDNRLFTGVRTKAKLDLKLEDFSPFDPETTVVAT
jgi:hypothetical protein